MDLNEFFSMLFEWLGYSESFSDDIYQEKLYSSIGLISLITSLALVVSFYFIINRVNFSRWYHWLIMLLINFVIAFLVGMLVPQNVFYGIGIDEYEAILYVIFGLKTALIATSFFIIWTYIFKWWYGNAKGTPKIFFGKF